MFIVAILLLIACGIGIMLCIFDYVTKDWKEFIFSIVIVICCFICGIYALCEGVNQVKEQIEYTYNQPINSTVVE